VNELFLSEALDTFAAREAAVGEEMMREIERRVMLSVLDQHWREHLYEMDYLREGIHLRAMGQRDPLSEWQREGFDMFEAMMASVRENFVSYMSPHPGRRRRRAGPPRQRCPRTRPEGPVQGWAPWLRPPRPYRRRVRGPVATAVADPEPFGRHPVHVEKTPGRNIRASADGKKYKFCHGRQS